MHEKGARKPQSVEDLYTVGRYQIVYMIVFFARQAQEWANNYMLIYAGQKPRFTCNNSGTFVSYAKGCQLINAGECANVTLKTDLAGTRLITIQNVTLKFF